MVRKICHHLKGLQGIQSSQGEPSFHKREKVIKEKAKIDFTLLTMKWGILKDEDMWEIELEKAMICIRLQGNKVYCFKISIFLSSDGCSIIKSRYWSLHLFFLEMSISLFDHVLFHIFDILNVLNLLLIYIVLLCLL